MPYRLVSDFDLNLVFVKWAGDFDVGEVRDFCRTLEGLDIHVRVPNVLHDARDWNLNVDTAEILRMAHDPRPALPPGARRRIGFVVDGDLAFGMMRVFATLRERPDVEIEVFRDFEPARQWLGIAALPPDIDTGGA